MAAQTAADGQWLRRIPRTIADSVGVTEWVEMGGEKQPLVMSELSCADGCGWQMGAEKCTDGCGQRGCKGVAGNGWGEEAADDERAWLRGRLRTANGLGELRGRLRTAWVPGCGWKWVGRRSRWRSASLALRTAADGKWMRRIARTAPDGVGATEWLEMGGEKKPLVMCELSCADGCGREMGSERIARTTADGVGARERLEMDGEKKPLVMSELGCADGCGRQMGEENCADGSGRRGCEGVAGNVWGDEGAGDERAWLRGRLRSGNGWGEFRGRLLTAWVQGSGWK